MAYNSVRERDPLIDKETPSRGFSESLSTIIPFTIFCAFIPIVKNKSSNIGITNLLIK